MTQSSWLGRLRGSAYLAYHARGQAGFSFQPLEVTERAQARRVRRMVAHAYRTVPYYRETMDRLGLKPGDVRTAADLARLPLVEREQVQRDPEYFVSTFQPLDRYLKLRSGGSSGAPRTIYHDAAAVLQNAAHGERHRSILTALLDQSLGYRVAIFAPPFSSSLEVQRFCQERTLIPAKARIQRQYLSMLDPLEQTVPLLNDFQPAIVVGYGSYLDLVASYLEATNAPFHRPRVVSYGGDSLSASGRRFFEQTLSIPVFSSYQAIEAFKIGFECERHVGLHLNLDLYPVCIVDRAGQTLPVGESGDVVVSNLVNRATVLLNYRLGDIAHFLPDPCACGRSLPLLSFPLGRQQRPDRVALRAHRSSTGDSDAVHGRRANLAISGRPAHRHPLPGGDRRRSDRRSAGYGYTDHGKVRGAVWRRDYRRDCIRTGRADGQGQGPTGRVAAAAPAGVKRRRTTLIIWR